MNTDELRTRLEKVFRETLGIESVPADLSQKNCAQWDSVAHLNLILALEAEFGAFFEPEEIGAMTTLREAENLLSRMLP